VAVKIAVRRTSRQLAVELKVIEPVGLKPPASAAESLIEPPTTTEAEAWVTTSGSAS